MRLPRLLAHHLMQAPDDGPPRRCPQRHAQSKSVDRHGVGSRSGVEVVHEACFQGSEGVAAFLMCGRLDTTAAGSVQGLQPGLQRHKRIRA